MEHGTKIWIFILILTVRRLLTRIATSVLELRFLECINGQLTSNLNKYSALRRLNTRWWVSAVRSLQERRMLSTPEVPHQASTQYLRLLCGRADSTIQGISLSRCPPPSDRQMQQSVEAKSAHRRPLQTNLSQKGAAFPLHFASADRYQKMKVEGNTLDQYPPVFFLRSRRVVLLSKAHAATVAEILFDSLTHAAQGLFTPSPKLNVTSSECEGVRELNGALKRDPSPPDSIILRRFALREDLSEHEHGPPQTHRSIAALLRHARMRQYPAEVLLEQFRSFYPRDIPPPEQLRSFYPRDIPPPLSSYTTQRRKNAEEKRNSREQGPKKASSGFCDASFSKPQVPSTESTFTRKLVDMYLEPHEAKVLMALLDLSGTNPRA
ncbi:hypothetical protein cyc_07167 [Cyclospora cayetanensis]|uniref:Uncharacterized protein n=1 Tax=Cyclospora cayetanensis TaxID=88456 RepID=A0A1D3CUB0_9EIME|nr:hypothetical protein cyc_07167 [Cyclospora cayetanensis]